MIPLACGLFVLMVDLDFGLCVLGLDLLVNHAERFQGFL
jgi:hypothetical protein